MPSRFEADFSDPKLRYDDFIDEVFGELKSKFIEMPKGEGFIDYPTFEHGYQTLKKTTDAFTTITPEAIQAAVEAAPIAFIVFRTILGFTPPEWANVTSTIGLLEIDQGPARAIDRSIRLKPLAQRSLGTKLTDQRIRAMIDAGVQTLLQGAQTRLSTVIHRLDKVDTRDGLRSLQPLADLGVPYAALLYERFLGRPFATHRDSVSELVGAVVEGAVKDVLTAAKVEFRETNRAERIQGFDQAPDFIIPSEFNPVALIEAKLTEDDGTARDKVTRVQRLRALRDESKQTYDVIACIAGRGFKVRREDMRRLLHATDGKVFTLTTMPLLVEHTRIREYKVR